MTLLPSQWSSLCGSISSFVYSLEIRKIFLKVWTRDLLTPMDFSSWTHPLATSLLCRNWVAHPPLPSAPLAAIFQEKLWSGCIKWGRGLRLWSLLSQSCLWQQNSNTLWSLGKTLSPKFSPFFLLLVSSWVPALSVLDPVEWLNTAYWDFWHWKQSCKHCI